MWLKYRKISSDKRAVFHAIFNAEISTVKSHKDSTREVEITPEKQLLRFCVGIKKDRENCEQLLMIPQSENNPILLLKHWLNLQKSMALLT